MTDRPLPTSTEVVVVGGGVVGVATAWFLARRGVPVLLLEKGRIAGEQSSRNWGWIRCQGRDPAELALMCESSRLWEEIAREVDGDIGFRRTGVTYLAESDADNARFEAWLAHARAHQLDSRMLTRAETDRLIGENRIDHRGALHTASDARAEPAAAVPAMARTLAARGVDLRAGCAVRAIERAGGRVTGVATEHGRVRCRAVVVAAGVWSRLLLVDVGLALPQLGVVASAQRTTPAPLVTESAVGRAAVALRRRADAGYTIARTTAATHEILPASLRWARLYAPVLKRCWRTTKWRLGLPFVEALTAGRLDGERAGPFERTRVLDPAPDHALLDDVLAAAARSWPQLAGVTPAQRWAGVIDVLPDELPALGPVPDRPGLIVATGFSGHGFGIGSAAGRVAAELAAGEGAIDLAALAPERFGPVGAGVGA
ncbi:MAG: FAD-dependent oxidoreductase [Alphaproteobacteria bacterium]|nr:FAD-dependent oxidoreductase [Alphaproteobacteria bacterium]